MVNNRGFIRIVEASISIVLVASVMFFIFAQTRTTPQEDFGQLGRDLLTEIASNNTLRQDILNNESAHIESFISNKIPSTLSYEFKICEINTICSKKAYTETNVFASERIISSTLNDYDPKKIKIFIWRG